MSIITKVENIIHLKKGMNSTLSLKMYNLVWHSISSVQATGEKTISMIQSSKCTQILLKNLATVWNVNTFLVVELFSMETGPSGQFVMPNKIPDLH